MANYLIGIIGAVLGLIGIIIGIISYNRSIRERIPVFLVEPELTPIIVANNLNNAPIRVIRKSDNKEIVSDLTAITFYFWNAGKEPIKSSNILKDLIIEFSNTAIKILDAKIIRTSREISGIHISENANGSSLLIGFEILEKDDGFAGQIIYEGAPKSKLLISGIIEEVNNIYDASSLPKSAIARKFRYKSLIVFGIMFNIPVIAISMAAIGIMEELFKFKLSPVANGCIVIILILISFLIIPILVSTGKFTYKMTKIDRMRFIPKSLKPEK
jgi:hypothetical protein